MVKLHISNNLSAMIGMLVMMKADEHKMCR